MFEYNDAAMQAASVLDKYDLADVLYQCFNFGWRDPFDIIEKGILVKYPELCDAVEDLSTDELMEYLSTRYKVRFEEVVSYRMWLPQ